MFFVVPLMFVLSLIVPEIVAVVLAPAGVLTSIIVLVFDIVCKFFWKKEQVFKMFVNFMLLSKSCNLYGLQTAACASAVIALICAFVIVIFFSIGMEKIFEDAEKINNL